MYFLRAYIYIYMYMYIYILYMYTYILYSYMYIRFELSLFLRFVPGYDGPLGCTMDRNGVTLSLWAPTALSVARQHEIRREI